MVNQAITKTYIIEGSLDGKSLTFLDSVISFDLLKKIMEDGGRKNMIKITIEVLNNDKNQLNVIRNEYN